MKNTKIIWGVVIVVIVVVAFGVYYIQSGTPEFKRDVNIKAATEAMMADWKTYTNSTTGFEVMYPATWKVTTSEVNGFIRVINPTREGKDDTDQPTEGVSIGFAQSACKEKPWEIGFAGVNYKTVCKPNINISAVAFDEVGKKIVDQIVSTFKFTSPAVKTETPKPVETSTPSKNFKISLVTELATIKTQVILEGENGFSIKVGDKTVQGFSGKAQVKLTKTNYSKLISREGNLETESLSFIVPDDVPAGDYKLQVLDFTDNTYKTSIMSNMVDFKIIQTPNCGQGKYWNGSNCQITN